MIVMLIKPLPEKMNDWFNARYTPGQMFRVLEILENRWRIQVNSPSGAFGVYSDEQDCFKVIEP